MNSNTLISCFSLWVIVEMISLLNTFFGGRILKKRYEMKRIYSTQLLFLLKKKGNEYRLLEILYVGLTNKSLRKILLKAIRNGSLNNQFAYIDKKIGCDIITLIHNHILHPVKSYEGLVKEVYDKLMKALWCRWPFIWATSSWLSPPPCSFRSIRSRRAC